MNTSSSGGPEGLAGGVPLATHAQVGADWHVFAAALAPFFAEGFVCVLLCCIFPFVRFRARFVVGGFAAGHASKW